MNFLQSLSSAVISASTAALSGGGGIPTLPNYSLGEKVSAFEGKSIWTHYDGIKKDDSTPVSVFVFDSTLAPSHHSSAQDRRALFPLAKNALRKLRTLRHPNILRLVDGVETDTAVWIVTETVTSLALALQDRQDGAGLSEESKVYGLLHLATALSFLNRDGISIHGNVRLEAVWVTQGGDWKLGGMEICTKKDEDAGLLWMQGGLLPDSRSYTSPEVRKSGFGALKDCDASALDSYQLHLFLFTLFNGPIPMSFSNSSDSAPALPNQRGSIPASLFQAWRRLGNPNPRPRLTTSLFCEMGNGSESTGGGWWPSNRLVKLSSALDGFSLASESERTSIIRGLKELEGGSTGGKARANPLPDNFLKYKILPSLVRAFEFGGGGPALLPLILSLSTSLPPAEYSTVVIQPLIRMFATPDRAMRMALLEGLDKFADKLTNKEVVEKIWPHLLTGFGDVVPVIREATVKSILLIAPKLTDRILNNDLLRLLAKTQTDAEPGIRTNTCILLGRLSQYLQPTTNRKVLVPAFARALRDPFVHARIAGLMALMATADCYEKEDLAGKVIPAMSICLVDRERTVRDQGYKAIDMFVKKCEALTANMPDIAPVENGTQQTAAHQAASANQPGLATTAGGAAGALAGWAFASVSKKLSAAELAAPFDPARANSTPPMISNAQPRPNPLNGIRSPQLQISRTGSEGSKSPALSLPGGFDDGGTEDWGGDLMDVNDDAADWDGFESAPAAPRVDPLAARLSSTKPKTLKLGGASKSSAFRIPMDLDAGDNWDLEAPVATKPIAKPKVNTVTRPAPVIPAVAVSKSTPLHSPSLSTTTAPSLLASPQKQPRPTASKPSTVPPKAAAVADDTWDTFEEIDSTKKTAAPVVANGGGELTKEEKAAKMAQMREERRQRMAKLKSAK